MSKEGRQRVAVVTDSTAYLPPDLAEEYGIHVVPLHLMLGRDAWLDGVEIDPPAFYEKLRSTSDFPTTSQPNVATFQDLFVDLAREADSIVAILISSDLSGTVDSARGAAANLPDMDIRIVDSRGTSMMLGFGVLEAARAAAAGKDADAVIAAARQVLEKTRLYFVVDTLEYLHRGGRIGGAQKLLGSALNLKPILELRDGTVQAVTKVRTRRKALGTLLSFLDEQIAKGDRVHMSVINMAALEEARALRDDLVSRYHPVEITINDVSPAIGAHAGPGTVGVVFYVE
jgi:DegV family protein with EDD domain